MRQAYPFPEGVKPGDFVQGLDHFGDVYFEVTHVSRPTQSCAHWIVFCHCYEKGGRDVGMFIGSSAGIRRVVAAEMGLPSLVAKRSRINAAAGLFA